MRVTAPLVLPFAGLVWPYGPGRVEVTLAPCSPPGRDVRSRVTAPELGCALLVDPGLPAPGDEGPLAPEAAALRACPPRAPVELVTRGPRAPWPGADTAAFEAACAGLAAAAGAEPPAPASVAARAVRAGRPALAATGELHDVAPAVVAWLDACLLLHRDRLEPAHEPAPPSDGAALFAGDPDAWLASVAGTGLTGAPRSQCERDLVAVLLRAGLRARWSLGGGVVLALATHGRGDELAATLREHDLDPLPLRLGGVGGAAPAPLSLGGFGGAGAQAACAEGGVP